MSQNLSLTGLDYISKETSKLDRSIRKEEECCKLIETKISSLHNNTNATRNAIAELKKKVEQLSKKVHLLDTIVHDCHVAHSKIDELIRNYTQEIYGKNKELVSKLNRFQSITSECEAKWQECKDTYVEIFQNSSLKALLIHVKNLKIERNKHTTELNSLGNKIDKLNTCRMLKMRIKIIDLAKMKKKFQNLLNDKAVLLKKMKHLDSETTKAKQTLKDVAPHPALKLSSKTKKSYDNISLEYHHEQSQEYARAKDVSPQFLSLKRPRISTSQELVPQLPEFDLLFTQDITHHSTVVTSSNKIQEVVTESFSSRNAQILSNPETDVFSTGISRGALTVQFQDSTNMQTNEKSFCYNTQPFNVMDHEDARESTLKATPELKKRQQSRNTQFQDDRPEQNPLQELCDSGNNEIFSSLSPPVIQDESLRCKQTPEILYQPHITQTEKENVINENSDNDFRTKSTLIINDENVPEYGSIDNMSNKANGQTAFAEEMDTSYMGTTHKNNALNFEPTEDGSNDGINNLQTVQSDLPVSQGSVSSGDDATFFSSPQIHEREEITKAYIKSKMSPEIYLKPHNLSTTERSQQKQHTDNNENELEPQFIPGTNNNSPEISETAGKADECMGDTITAKPNTHIDTTNCPYGENEVAEDANASFHEGSQSSQYFTPLGETPAAETVDARCVTEPEVCNMSSPCGTNYEGMVCSPTESDYGDTYMPLVLSPEGPGEQWGDMVSKKTDFPGLNFGQPFSSNMSLFRADDGQQNKQGGQAAQDTGGFQFFSKSSNTSSLFSLF